MQKFMVLSSIESEDVEPARIIISNMFSEIFHGQVVLGGFPDDIFRDAYNSSGEGSATHYLCFSSHTQYYIDKWLKMIEKYNITSKCPSYTFHKVDTKEDTLLRMNLKKIEQ